tara:strand:- start:2146 stop:3336 length:1191 start_codon:yes stop_codon:yes gene_type:complete
MKYIVLLGDGMPDHPLPDHDNKTPLQIANTPNMDFLAKSGITGGIKTIPDGFPPGSDVSNLSIFGYNPEVYYTGRSPLEAASMGVDLDSGDIAFRCNLVTLKPVMNDLVMEDYSAGHISSEEAKELINFLNSKLGNENYTFYPGVSYRHLLVWKGGKEKMDLPPPHDLTGKGIKDSVLSRRDEIIELLNYSQMLLKNHAVNLKRAGEGKRPANCIWLWGSGKKPAMPNLKKMYDLEGAVISAVDLLKGIGIYAGLDAIKVPGATGYIDTNYEGKVKSALKILEEKNFVYIHLEAADETSHEGSFENKIKAIEDFDSKVVGKVLKGISGYKKYKVLLTSDHPTPLSLMTHTAEKVPFAVYSPNMNGDKTIAFSEDLIKEGSKNFEKGFEIMEYFVRG